MRSKILIKPSRSTDIGQVEIHQNQPGMVSRRLLAALYLSSLSIHFIHRTFIELCVCTALHHRKKYCSHITQLG